MPTLNINGKRVTVDDSFLKLSPEEQNRTVDEIASQIGGPQQPSEPSARSGLPPVRGTDVFIDEMGFGLPGKASSGINALFQRGMAALPGDSPWEGQGIGDLYQADRQNYIAARDQYAAENPKSNLTATIGGALFGGGKALGVGEAVAKGVGGKAARLLPSFVPQAVGKAMSGTTGRVAADLAGGAGLGALSAYGHDQDIGTGAALGAAGGAAGGAIARGVSGAARGVAGAFNKKPAIPSIDDIRASASAAYDAAEAAGVAYTPQAVSNLSKRVTTELADMGFDPAIMPGAAAALNRLNGLQGQNVTLKGLDTVRKVASNGFIPGNKANNAAISKIIAGIDDAIQSPAKGDVLMGDAAGGAAAIKEARGLASRLAKSEKVSSAINKADLRAASTGSGGNVDNATRQNLRRLLENPRGFTPDEIAALEDVVRGTPSQNAMRLVGKLSPSGNGLMAALGIGGTAVNPLLAAVPAAGMGAKYTADTMTRKNTALLDAIIRAGGSKSATQATPNAAQKFIDANRRRLIDAMLAVGSSPMTLSESLQKGHP